MFSSDEHWIARYQSAYESISALLVLIEADDVDEAEFSRLMLLYAQSLAELELDKLDTDPEFTREPLEKLAKLNEKLSILAQQKRLALARQFDDQRSTRKGLNEYTKHSE